MPIDCADPCGGTALSERAVAGQSDVVWGWWRLPRRQASHLHPIHEGRACEVLRRWKLEMGRHPISGARHQFGDWKVNDLHRARLLPRLQEAYWREID